MVQRLLLSGIVAMALVSQVFASDPTNALQFKMKTLDGEEIELSKYAGKVVLFVNVASKCGLTPQYADLQSLYEKYQDKGLVIVGIPCNQFGGQEPGSVADIKQTCEGKYHITFDMLSKVEVNGKGACDLYKYLTGLEAQPVGKGDISWNFEKFVVDRQGQVIGRFSPRTKPADEKMIEVIEKALAEEVK